MRLALVAALLLAGCSVLLPLSGPGGPADLGPGLDLPTRDVWLDGPQPDRRPDAAVDLPSLDLPPPVQPDTLPPDIPQPDQPIPGACAVDADCEVASNCCECSAYLKVLGPPSCPLPCMTLTCTDTWKMASPVGYCVKGRCVVGDNASCIMDADCHMVDDCCNCLALPKSVPAPYCPPISCVMNVCYANGLGGTIATCVNGRCRLAPSP